jgi:hypothetical protein
MFERKGNKSNYPSIIDTTLLHFSGTDGKHHTHVPLSAEKKNKTMRIEHQQGKYQL